MAGPSLEALAALDGDAPLPAVFAVADSLSSSLDALLAGPGKESLPAAQDLFARLDASVEAQGIFSSNEDADDIATGDLKYLLAPYLRAQLLNSMPAASPAERLGSVQAAKECYLRFLHRCEQYNLLGGLGSSIHLRMEEGGMKDPNERRMAKVEKFRRDKQIKAQLQELERQRQGSWASASGTNAAAEHEENGTERRAVGGPGAVDEEDERRLWTLRIELAALDAMEQQERCGQELELLQMGLQQRAGRGPGQPSSSNGAGPSSAEAAALRKVMMDSLRNVVSDLDGSKREHIRSRVFMPGHNMPTMTLTELAHQEMEEAQQRAHAEQRAAEAKARKDAERGDPDLHEDEDELREQRAWDDYKDDNPKGWGNSKLRPCA